MIINIQLIDDCNLSCKMCGFVSRKTNKEMSIDALCKILDELKGILVHGRKIKWIRLDGNGEALLHKNLKQAIIETKKRFRYCTLITNGTLLTEKVSTDIIEAGLTSLVVSVAGLTPQVYSYFQGYGKTQDKVAKQLDNVVKNVEKLTYLNKRCNNPMNVQISYLLTKDSLQDAFKASAFWKTLGGGGVDSITFATVNNAVGQLKEYDYKMSQKFCPNVNVCFKTITILANGDVCVCCNDSLRASASVMGNVFNVPFREIINSYSYRSFVDSLTKFDMTKLPVCCQKCDLIRILE